MSGTPDLADTIASVVGVLRRRRLAYFVSGSVASSVHGEFRATNDVDLVVALTQADVLPLMADLDGEFVADAEQAHAALAAGSSFNLIHRRTFLKVDVFPCQTAFDRMAMTRATDVPLPGVDEVIRVATAEDVLVAKLRWYALASETSESQRRDIRALIALNRSTLDLDHVRRWAAALGVGEVAERFLGEP